MHRFAGQKLTTLAKLHPRAPRPAAPPAGGINERISHLDVVQDELVSVFGGGHLAVSDGFSQCLLGNEGIQVEDGGQTAVQADELVLIGAEVNCRKRRRRRRDDLTPDLDQQLDQQLRVCPHVFGKFWLTWRGRGLRTILQQAGTMGTHVCSDSYNTLLYLHYCSHLLTCRGRGL